MICKSCGAVIGDFDNNCSQCGAPVVNDSVPFEPVAEQPVNPQPVYTQNDYQQPVYTQNNYQQPTYPQNGYQQPAYQQPGYPQDGYQQPYQPTNYQPAPPQAEVKDPGKGLGIASMVLGIVGFVFCCCLGAFTMGATSLIAPICLIVGLILGIVAKSKSKSVGIKNAPATAGIVLSSIPLALGLILILVVAIFGSTIIGMLLPYLEEMGLGDLTYMLEDVLGEFGMYY